jgi:hypothetical protein
MKSNIEVTKSAAARSEEAAAAARSAAVAGARTAAAVAGARTASAVAGARSAAPPGARSRRSAWLDRVRTISV